MPGNWPFSASSSSLPSEDALTGSLGGELSGLFAEWRRSFLEEPSPDIAAAHMAAMLEAALGPDSPTFERKAPSERLARAKGRLAAHRARVVAIGVAGAVTLSAGLAAAGQLPAPIQHAASSAARLVGVHIPDPQETNSGGSDTTEGTNGGSNGNGTQASGSSGPGGTGPNGSGTNHGSQVSQTAHTTTGAGCEHGRAVSAVASSNAKGKGTTNKADHCKPSGGVGHSPGVHGGGQRPSHGGGGPPPGHGGGPPPSNGGGPPPDHGGVSSPSHGGSSSPSHASGWPPPGHGSGPSGNHGRPKGG